MFKKLVIALTLCAPFAAMAQSPVYVTYHGDHNYVAATLAHCQYSADPQKPTSCDGKIWATGSMISAKSLAGTSLQDNEFYVLTRVVDDKGKVLYQNSKPLSNPSCRIEANDYNVLVISDLTNDMASCHSEGTSNE